MSFTSSLGDFNVVADRCIVIALEFLPREDSPCLASPQGDQDWMTPLPRPLSVESQTEEQQGQSSPPLSERAGLSPQTESLPLTGAIHETQQFN